MPLPPAENHSTRYIFCQMLGMNPEWYDVSMIKGKIAIAFAMIFSCAIIFAAAPVHAQSADTQPPTVPSGLSATAIPSSQVSLSWSASTDDIGVVGYYVYRNGVEIVSSADTSFIDSGLAPGMYSYTSPRMMRQETFLRNPIPLRSRSFWTPRRRPCRGISPSHRRRFQRRQRFRRSFRGALQPITWESRAIACIATGR